MSLDISDSLEIDDSTIEATLGSSEAKCKSLEVLKLLGTRYEHYLTFRNPFLIIGSLGGD